MSIQESKKSFALESLHSSNEQDENTKVYLSGWRLHIITVALVELLF